MKNETIGRGTDPVENAAYIHMERKRAIARMFRYRMAS